MPRALLMVNHFLRTHKFEETYAFIERAASAKNIELTVLTNLECLKNLGSTLETAQKYVNEAGFDFVLFWDKDIRLAKLLENLGLTLFNSSRAIEVCDDKSLTYVELLKSGIKMPKTLISPKAFAYSDLKSEYLDFVEGELGYPLILKECFGSFGMQVYLINNRRELEEKDEELGIVPVIYQEFIKTSYGRDLRLNVVGDRVIAAIYREATNGGFQANLTLGGSMKPHKPSAIEAEMALSAVKALGLDFAGVDLLIGEGGEPILGEVNSNTQFVNLYNATGVNMPDSLFDYILRKMGV